MKQYQINEVSFGNILSKILVEENVTDVMIWNGDIWISDIICGHYRYDLTIENQDDIQQLLEIIDRLPRQIALAMEVVYNESQPIIDGEAIFGSFGQLRFSCISEAITGNSTAIAIRKSRHSLRLNDDYIVKSNYASEKFISLMKCLVKAGCNIMICGLTGSGKTELLRYLAKFIDDNEAIITIEDTYEAYLKELYPMKNVLSLKSNAYFEIKDILRPCLRQNPDWICVSETRGDEVLQLLEAISTGHHMISTIHCDSTANIPLRMIEMSRIKNDSTNSILQQIYAHLDIGIYIYYYNSKNGATRYISEISEYYKKDKQVFCNRIYEFDSSTKEIVNSIIKSPRILRKLKQRHIDISKIEGEFISD